MSRHELDMAAVQQDAITVQGLSTRSMDDLDLDDPVVAALATWVSRIDEGIDDTIPFSIGRDAAVNAAPEAGRGRRAALVAGSTVLALVVSGGAAAAVTGDPLLVVKAPFRAIAEVNPFDDDASNARDRLPDQAPAVADANKLLADAQRAMARGDVEEAERLLAEAESLLGDAVNPGQQNRIDKIADGIAGNTGGSKADDDRGPRTIRTRARGTRARGTRVRRTRPARTRPQDKTRQDKDPKGEQAVDKDPVDKDPVDKDPQGGKPAGRHVHEAERRAIERRSADRRPVIDQAGEAVEGDQDRLKRSCRRVSGVPGAAPVE